MLRKRLTFPLTTTARDWPTAARRDWGAARNCVPGRQVIPCGWSAATPRTGAVADTPGSKTAIDGGVRVAGSALDADGPQHAGASPYACRVMTADCCTVLCRCPPTFVNCPKMLCTRTVVGNLEPMTREPSRVGQKIGWHIVPARWQDSILIGRRRHPHPRTATTGLTRRKTADNRQVATASGIGNGRWPLRRANAAPARPSAISIRNGYGGNFRPFD